MAEDLMSMPPVAASAAPVLLETIENGVALLVMNRPDKLNSLNNELAAALTHAFEKIGKNDDVRVVVLTGAGRAFCAGGDLAAIGKGREARDSKQLEPILRMGMGAMLRMRMIPQPVIAAVNGAAAGAGMNVAVGADIRIAAADAVFGQNFAKIGLLPDYGVQCFFSQLGCPSQNTPLFFTRATKDAHTARGS